VPGGGRRPRLLTLRAVEARTQERFGSSSLDLGGLILRRAGDRSIADVVEVELGSPLPEAFRRCISRYRLDELRWHVSFGSGKEGGSGYGRQIAAWNADPPLPGMIPWWRPFERPSHLVMVGQSTGFVVLLDLVDGTVRACSEGQDPRTAITAATDFELLLRGLGTLLLDGPNDELLRSRIAEAVGGGAGFWRAI
jgi:hypothetical protein